MKLCTEYRFFHTSMLRRSEQPGSNALIVGDSLGDSILNVKVVGPTLDKALGGEKQMHEIEDRSKDQDHIHIAGPKRYEEDLIDDHKDSIVQTYFAHRVPKYPNQMVRPKKLKTSDEVIFAIIAWSSMWFILGLAVGILMF